MFQAECGELQLRLSLLNSARPGMGSLRISWNPEGLLSGISLKEAVSSRASSEFTDPVKIPHVAMQLMLEFHDYFSSGQPLRTIPWDFLDQSGWSEFQRKVYQTITLIPHGETRTYGWVAYRMGSWGAGRAVGQALRNNPFPVLIPCHRVVAAGSLGGFMGCGDPNQPELHMKQQLIALEETYLNPFFSFVSPGEAAVSVG
jgi:O-6-methylguanine DNA methyltransferase